MTPISSPYDPFVQGQVVREAVRQSLLDWCLELKRTGALRTNTTGPFRFYEHTRALPCPPEYWHVLAQVRDAIRLTRESQLGHYVSVIEPGGFVHAHLDAEAGVRQHPRINLMLQCAPGADPVIGALVYPVKDGEAWAFDAARWTHGTGIIRERCRVVLGFGFTIP